MLWGKHDEWAIFRPAILVQQARWPVCRDPRQGSERAVAVFAEPVPKYQQRIAVTIAVAWGNVLPETGSRPGDGACWASNVARGTWSARCAAVRVARARLGDVAVRARRRRRLDVAVRYAAASQSEHGDPQ